MRTLVETLRMADSDEEVKIGRDIVLEKGMNFDFLDEIRSIPGGEAIANCIQCGSCSGSCPTSYYMDFTPRKIFAMVRAGMRKDVLASKAIWLCASCYLCASRCPKEIKVTDIMYALKRAAIKDGRLPRGIKAPVLAREFASIVDKYGRNHEMEILMRFYLKSDIRTAIKSIPLATRLFLKGRLSLLPGKIRRKNELRTILREAQAMEGI